MKTILIALTAFGFLFSGESTATYRVEGMMCAMNCPQKVNDSLNGVDGIKSCKVDFESKTATVIFDNEKIDSEKIAKTIAKGTYYKVMDLNKKEKSGSFWDWLFGKS
jgi:copper chaperone CopZ|tara:strand:+ start:281 stop:601 length:321 start_codon:yes stop_codon:yes gene_type:complete